MSNRKAHAWRQAAFAGRPPGSHFPTPKEGVANQKCHTQQGLLEGTHAVDVSIYIYIQIYRYIYRQIQSSTCCQKVSRTICKSSCCTNGRFAEAFAWTDGISTGVIYIYIYMHIHQSRYTKTEFSNGSSEQFTCHYIYIYTQRCCSKQNCNLLVAVITRDGLFAAPPSKVNSH